MDDDLEAQIGTEVEIRRRTYWFLLPLLIVFACWFLPTLPIASLFKWQESARGKELFDHEWQPADPLAKGDGLGPLFNGRSCRACHPLGGASESSNGNEPPLTQYQIVPADGSANPFIGYIHRFAREPGQQSTLEKLLAAQKQNQGSGAEKKFVRVTEMMPPALFGLGLIDQLPDEAIKQFDHDERFAGVIPQFGLDMEALAGGRTRFLKYGIGKFGSLAQFETLEECVAHECAQQLGLSNASAPQAEPMGTAAKADSQVDLSADQVKVLAEYVRSLPKPRVVWPSDGVKLASAQLGEKLFHQIGCGVCHAKRIGTLDGVYTDFRLHRIHDTPAKSEASSGNAAQLVVSISEEWKTPALWGVADTAPYFHDGQSPTLHDAIVRHAGSAKSVTRAYNELGKSAQQSLIDFLLTLREPKDSESR